MAILKIGTNLLKIGSKLLTVRPAPQSQNYMRILMKGSTVPYPWAPETAHYPVKPAVADGVSLVEVSRSAQYTRTVQGFSCPAWDVEYLVSYDGPWGYCDGDIDPYPQQNAIFNAFSSVTDDVKLINDGDAFTGIELLELHADTVTEFASLFAFGPNGSSFQGLVGSIPELYMPNAVNVDLMFGMNSNVEGGISRAYNYLKDLPGLTGAQYSHKYHGCFYRCGQDDPTGAAELSLVPCLWKSLDACIEPMIYEKPVWSNRYVLPSAHPKLWNVRNPEALPGEDLYVDLYTWNGCYVQLVDMIGNDPEATEPELWPGELKTGATFDRTEVLQVPSASQGLYPTLNIMINDDALSQ